jgi:hypothetical protein
VLLTGGWPTLQEAYLLACEQQRGLRGVQEQQMGGLHRQEQQSSGWDSQQQQRTEQESEQQRGGLHGQQEQQQRTQQSEQQAGGVQEQQQPKEGIAECRQHQEHQQQQQQQQQPGQAGEGQQAGLQPPLQRLFVQHDSLACHHLLLEAAGVLLHHGGSGTTAAALAAGVPQLVCPLQFDQHFWVGGVLPYSLLYALYAVSCQWGESMFVHLV